MQCPKIQAADVLGYFSSFPALLIVDIRFDTEKNNDERPSAYPNHGNFDVLFPYRAILFLLFPQIGWRESGIFL